jgi:putative NIF3 family GTP cyclohydrolase 1 type 2
VGSGFSRIVPAVDGGMEAGGGRVVGSGFSRIAPGRGPWAVGRGSWRTALVYHAAVTTTLARVVTPLATALLCAVHGSLPAAPVDAAAVPPAAALTAQQIVERIKSQVGVPWQADTVDTFKAGNPATRVTGIAVTMMATLDVLQRAAKAGHNLVVTHEPTFFDHRDPTAPLENAHDSVFAAKMAFIRNHGLVVWRFHDHWHSRQPDGVQAGMLRALGWDSPEGQAPMVVTRPPTTLARLAADIRNRLGAHALRVVGRPDMPVTKVALAPGAAGFALHRAALQRDDVQVLVIGEAREWETVEYVDDAVAAGQEKALVIIGHIPSEQAGMEECARWLKGLVAEVPVEFVPAADPFWQPE